MKTGNDAKQNAALDFIRYATGKGYQQTVDAAQIVPTIEGFKAPSSFTGLRAEFQKTLKGKTALAFNTNLLGMNANFDKTMTGILSGQTTPAQAAAASQQQLEQGAQAAGLKGW